MNDTRSGIIVHTVADPHCELHQEWPTKPDTDARCEACRDDA